MARGHYSRNRNAAESNRVDAIVSITVKPSGSWQVLLEQGDAKDLYLLGGNIEIRLDDWLIVLGKFEGALFLFPTLADLLGACAQLSGLAPRISIDFTGNESPLVILRVNNKRPGIVKLIGARETSPPVSAHQLVKAFGVAIIEFFDSLAVRIPRERWPEDAVEIETKARFFWSRESSY